MDELAKDAILKFQGRHATVGILGLGYAGLPLACCFAEQGIQTVGFDIDKAKVEALCDGRSYLGHLDAQRIERLVRMQTLRPTTDFDQLSSCDAAIICVPTPLGEGRTPDLTYVRQTAREISLRLSRGQLVVLESTTYPGTTDEVLREIFATRAMEPGRDYFLAFSPEREDPANGQFVTRRIPKIVGGVTDNCLAVACAAYGTVVDRVVPVSSARVAEATKLLENIYRCVNIAMVNELKLLFERMRIDIWEVIEAAATKPFGFMPFYPGPGLGGHCIPIDPFYLTWKARQFGFPTRFIELAGEINSVMPDYVISRLAHGLNLEGKPFKGAEILVIGVAYKRNIDDVRESPALAIIRELERRLARVSYHDPHVPHLRSRHLLREMKSVSLTPEAIRQSDAAVIVTDHNCIDYPMLLEHCRLVVDSRNATAQYRKPGHNVISA
jgi:UDP-N-acetyl-D-glucosamine dehydrogenase